MIQTQNSWVHIQKEKLASGCWRAVSEWKSDMTQEQSGCGAVEYRPWAMCRPESLMKIQAILIDYFLECLKNPVHLPILKCSRKENFPSLNQPWVQMKLFHVNFWISMALCAHLCKCRESYLKENPSFSNILGILRVHMILSGLLWPLGQAFAALGLMIPQMYPRREDHSCHCALNWPARGAAIPGLRRAMRLECSFCIRMTNTTFWTPAL